MTKKRTIIILIGFIIALTFYLTDIAAIDAPHNEGNSLYCQDCHVGPQFPLVLYWFPDFIPQTIDDTPFNMLCLSLCHFGSSAPYEEGKGPWVKTHSSVTTGD